MISENIKGATCIGFGAISGALSRHYLNDYYKARYKGPWGIAAINIIGSFLLGSLLAVQPNKFITTNMRLLIGTGFCGSFTTFSTFSVDTLVMIQQKSYLLAGSYVLFNNLGSIGAASVGYLMIRKCF